MAEKMGSGPPFLPPPTNTTKQSNHVRPRNPPSSPHRRPHPSAEEGVDKKEGGRNEHGGACWALKTRSTSVCRRAVSSVFWMAVEYSCTPRDNWGGALSAGNVPSRRRGRHACGVRVGDRRGRRQ
eukprot:scaffold2445_cov205-Alexandrium_tamarense.AAC.19